MLEGSSSIVVNYEESVLEEKERERERESKKVSKSGLAWLDELTTNDCFPPARFYWYALR
jgi:hypothetical protein